MPTQTLDGTWQLILHGPSDGPSEWRAAVPTGVHETLLAAGDIRDPFPGPGAEEESWIEEREWSFTRSLAGLGPRAAGHRDRLVFERLDGRAAVLVGGIELARHNSTFFPLEVDVTELVDDDTELEVRFEPIARSWEGREIPGAWGYYYAADRAWARKPQCQFSWDHCPRYVNVSLGSVRLERRSSARLRNPWVRVLDLDERAALVMLRADVEQWASAQLTAEVALSFEGEVVATTPAEPVDDELRTVLRVPEPRAWWPNGAGAQPLYEARITLRADGQIVDEWRHPTGLRTVELRREPQMQEPGAESFTFVVNGQPVFAKGANWVPPDLLAMRSGRRVEQLEMLALAGGNMVRDWGGGDYETDDFYAACDRLGILVWQDFMYSCARYPDDDPEFLALATAEAEYQIQRLRNHPSLVLWCGSNENEWHEDTENPEAPGHDFPGSHLYRRLLPALVERLSPDIPYWPCSPYGGEDHNSELVGNRHNWSTWHGNRMQRRFGEPPGRVFTPQSVGYRHLGEDKGRFISEFGVHAIPSLRTMRRYLDEEDLYLGSPVLREHDKNIADGRLDLFLDAHAPPRETLEAQVWWSQLCQAEALKLAIETARSRMWSCSGIMFWQWNDCWPAISWSVLDVDLRPKSGFWAAQRAWAPVLACAIDRHDRVEVWLVNDRPESVEHDVAWELRGFDGRVRYAGDRHVALDARSAELVEVLAVSDLTGDDRQERFVAVHLDGEFVNRTLLCEPRDLRRERPDLTVSWQQDGDDTVASLVSDGHALAVHFEADDPLIQPEDSWFDLLPGASRRIRVRRRGGGSVDPAEVEVSWS